ncbi:hypothetical protein FPZ54_15450 [Sphingomonas suaedae]|uniref:Uncharacterized protein n=1 Tax=Sphingomonas suaedae TaxID=2599297 RepID=A0A518RIK8_9SPHN|nr:hypothetical protein [Sphingomonas suaedae]QDX27261.1 hypothetical protein FPZ54_15450 [Sphingomonas suaedae]
MKLVKTLCAVAALTLSGLGTATAQTLEYDCDTQAEHFSVLKAVQSGPDYRVTGNISLRETFAVKKYLTLGVVQFEPEDGSWRARLGIVVLPSGKQTTVIGTLEVTRNGVEDPPKILGEVGAFVKGQTYPIALTLGAGGGTATLGRYSAPVTVPASGKVDASIICSGGEFLFTDLKLGG